ncbi:MAG: hypothetical protein E7603_09565 [Ruminococcaceae bacterium]|nr:hypothetical protein [Oscillospiraceae bacterium]
MKNENKKKRSLEPIDPEKKNNHLKDIFYHTRPESMQDCTGYTPVIPLSAEESESYEDLMDIPAPARYKKHNEDFF